MPISKVILGWVIIVIFLLAVTIIPFLIFDTQVTEFIKRELYQNNSVPVISVLVIVLLALDVLFPVPSSIVGIAAGALLGVALGVFSIWVGLTFGSLLGYSIGRFGGHRFGKRLVGVHSLERVGNFADNYGLVAIAFSRPIPILAEATSIVFGMSKMNFLGYLIVCSGSNLAIALIYGLTGALALNQGSVWVVIVASLLIPLPGWLIYRLLKSKHL